MLFNENILVYFLFSTSDLLRAQSPMILLEILFERGALFGFRLRFKNEGPRESSNLIEFGRIWVVGGHEMEHLEAWILE